MIVRRNRPSQSAHQRLIVRRGIGFAGPSEPDEPRPPVPHFVRWLVLALAAMVLLAVALSAWAWRTAFFDISSVQVEGNDRVATDIVDQLVGLEGDLIFTADVEAATARLREHPLVANASVEREWPHGITVTVHERQPWGVWEQGGVLHTIDREGYVLGTFPPDPDAVAIRSSATEPLHLGDRVDLHAVDAAAQVYEELPTILGVEVLEVAYIDGAGVQITTSDGKVALLGDSSSISYKLSAWGAIAREAAEQSISYSLIDLRYGDRPVLIPGETP